MRAIAQRDTAIENAFAALLAQAGFTFTVQDATLPGRPDFVVPEYRCAIFAHGCFGITIVAICLKVPATRTAFWLEKIGKERRAR